MLGLQGKDSGKSLDALTLKKSLELLEKGNWVGEFALTKYDFSSLSEADRLQADHDLATLSKAAMKDKWGDYFVSDEVIGKNLLLNAGINLLTNLLAGAGGTAFNNANARIGVGDSTTAAAAAQTGLQAATNKTYQAMDATYPTSGASQQIIFRSTFGSSAANYHWQEFITDNGTTSLNRLVSDQGTKTTGQSWQVTLTITLS